MLQFMDMQREEVMGVNQLDRRYVEGNCELSVKYLEITGYLGFSWQWRLVMYVINSATAFQKLTVVCCDQEALARACHDFQHAPSVHYVTGPIFRTHAELSEYYRENMWWAD